LLTSNFKGFFETEAALNAVPNPIPDVSYAFLKTATGLYMGKRYVRGASGNEWQSVLPYGALSCITKDSGGTITVAQPFHGITKNEMTEVTDGVLTIKDTSSKTIKVTAKDKGASGTEQSKEVSELHFVDGIYVDMSTTPGVATITHPQQVVKYGTQWEEDHKEAKWTGNIFFDENSQSWIGYSNGLGPDKVPKWTRIAHRGMSEEVNSLIYRLPSRAPLITPGVTGDENHWGITSWTYVEKDDTQLPQDVRSVCGGYFFTIIKDIGTDMARPEQRIQIFYADKEGSGVYIRRWNKDAGPSDQGWFPWAKVSMSKLDIDTHDKDPGAHSTHHKFYKVCTFNTLLSSLKGNAYVIRDSDMMLLGDNYGISTQGEEKTPVPYTGSFRFVGKMTLNMEDDAKAPFATSQWLLKVMRTRGSTTTAVYEATYNHSDHTKPMASMSWESGDISLEYGDKISLRIQPMNDANWSATYPLAQFIPMRSYFVMEDVRTRAGTRLAESQRRLMGPLYARDNVGVNAHYAKGSTTSMRLYSAPVDTNFKVMTKV
ncbi:MAG: hypothetical protein ACRDC4_05710, partial [Plesiomonas sp.]